MKYCKKVPLHAALFYFYVNFVFAEIIRIKMAL